MAEQVKRQGLRTRARQAITRRVEAVRTAPSRARKAVRQYMDVGNQPGRGRRLARKVGGSALSVGSALAMAQAKIAPAAVGGYLAAMAEEKQRVAHAEGIAKTGPDGKPGKSGALIADPTYRCAAHLGLAAVVAVKTQGMVRDVAVGYAGGIGAIYHTYRSKSGHNPTDGFLDAIKNGEPGI